MLRAIRNLDYVVLLCQDMASMRKFYHELLGFPIYREWGKWVEMQVGAVLLTLRPRGRPYDGPALPSKTAAGQLAFRVSPGEVESCYRELLRRGISVLQPPKSESYGHKTLFFKDPEGNILEIYADI
jgi:catechol-2,3-dioxygenase